jgi:transcriptional regulator with XRE-family HTH domain
MGMPFRLSDLDELIVSIDEITSAAANFGRHFWGTYLSATESGITYAPRPGPVREEVQRLRDEIVRRTRLTRQQIARALGVDRRSLSSWASGTAVPTAERLERLQHLAATVREIDAMRPGEATEVLLARRNSGDILDLIARGELEHVRNWQRLPPGQAVARVTNRQVNSAKQPLYAAALAAYLDGRLSVPPRAHTVREQDEYEQDLAGAELAFPDDGHGPRRGRYR